MARGMTGHTSFREQILKKSGTNIFKAHRTSLKVNKKS